MSDLPVTEIYPLNSRDTNLPVTEIAGKKRKVVTPVAKTSGRTESRSTKRTRSPVVDPVSNLVRGLFNTLRSPPTTPPDDFGNGMATPCYVNWSVVHDMGVGAEWMELRHLRDWIVSANAMKYHLKNARDQLRTDYSRIPRNVALYSKTSRFPDGLYVLAAGTAIGSAMRTLLSACDVPDRAINKEHISVDLSDPHKLYVSTLERLQTFLGARTLSAMSEAGIFARENFETDFALTWSA